MSMCACDHGCDGFSNIKMTTVKSEVHILFPFTF